VVSACIVHTGSIKPGVPRAQTEVDVFERKEICLVEESDGREDFPPDQHDAAADRVDATHPRRTKCGHPPAGDAVTHPSRAFGKRDTGRRHMVRLFAREQNRSNNSQGAIAAHRAGETLNCIRFYDRVAVHQQDKLRTILERCPDAHVAAAGEPKVLV